MPGPEASVKTWVRNYLNRKLPGIYIANIHQSMYSHKGIPDLVLCYSGKFVGLEVKTEQGRLSKLQEIELGKIKAAGGESIVIYGKDQILLDSLIERLKLHDTTIRGLSVS